MASVVFLLLVTVSLRLLDPSDGQRCGHEDSHSELTKEELERYGDCVPYRRGERGGPCDTIFVPKVDYVYIPHQRSSGNIDGYLNNINSVTLITSFITERCLEPLIKVLCHYYLPTCGNSSTFEPPTSVCTEECNYIAEICPSDWSQLRESIENLNYRRFGFINCSNTGKFLDPLPYCCSDAGIDIPCTELDDSGKLVSESLCIASFLQPSSTLPDSLASSTAMPNSSHQTSGTVAITVGSVCAAVAVLLLVVIGVILWLLIKKRGQRKEPESWDSVGVEQIQGREVSSRYHDMQPPFELPRKAAEVPSGYVRQMSKGKLLIPGKSIQLQDCIGQGEFGVVYRATVNSWKEYEQELVAVKTLKGVFSGNELNNLIEESLKMSKFNHPNVMRLVGVCIDGGESPYIVMPFMTHGSLLSYLRKHRAELTIANSDNMELVTTAQNKLVSMCLQIAKGMSYLASEKFVHRDLAARNCMIDENFVIKVADFGLSEDIYAKNYFRQGKLGEEGGDQVKLPVRWMALESLNDGVFTEKTDVWSFGVTCWEVFSLGKSPYPGLDPFTLIKYLERGDRLEKPVNAACSQGIYDIMKKCWEELPDNRPTFSDLVTTISASLEAIAGYLDLILSSSVPLTPPGTCSDKWT